MSICLALALYALLSVVIGTAMIVQHAREFHREYGWWRSDNLFMEWLLSVALWPFVMLGFGGQWLARRIEAVLIALAKRTTTNDGGGRAV